jgi:hypothetical protein
LNGGGIVINSYDPLSLRGLSDFNAFHQLNANLVYLLPFGKNQRFLGGANPLLDALVGGWHVSGIFRWTSGFPITVDNGFTWATNWNIEGDAMPNGPAPKATNSKNAMVNGVGIVPDIFADPDAALAAFRPEWPGESGVRNNVIGDGMFNIDTGVSKSFSLGEQRRLEFSWQAFNAFNSVRYDVRGAQPGLSQDATQFGNFPRLPRRASCSSRCASCSESANVSLPKGAPLLPHSGRSGDFPRHSAKKRSTAQPCSSVFPNCSISAHTPHWATQSDRKARPTECCNAP